MSALCACASVFSYLRMKLTPNAFSVRNKRGVRAGGEHTGNGTIDCWSGVTRHGNRRARPCVFVVSVEICFEGSRRKRTPRGTGFLVTRQHRRRNLNFFEILSQTHSTLNRFLSYFFFLNDLVLMSYCCFPLFTLASCPGHF